MSGEGDDDVIIIRHNKRQRVITPTNPLYTVAIALSDGADGDIVDPPEISPGGTQPE